MLMRECIHDVDVRATVRDHHAFGTRRGAAGVVDGDEVSLVAIDAIISCCYGNRIEMRLSNIDCMFVLPTVLYRLVSDMFSAALKMVNLLGCDCIRRKKKVVA